MARRIAVLVMLLSMSLAHADAKPKAITATPSITAGNLCGFIQRTERVHAESFDKVKKAVREAVKSGARLYYETYGGGMDMLVDIEIYEVRGTRVSRTLYTLREGDDTRNDRADLEGLGLTRHKTNSGDCKLIEDLQALREGKPTSILQVLAVKDADRSDFYYLADQAKFLEVFDDLKPYKILGSGEEIQLFCRAPGHYYKSRSTSSYSPRSELAPFIEAELARHGIVLNKQGIPLKK